MNLITIEYFGGSALYVYFRGFRFSSQFKRYRYKTFSINFIIRFWSFLSRKNDKIRSATKNLQRILIIFRLLVYQFLLPKFSNFLYLKILFKMTRFAINKTITYKGFQRYISIFYTVVNGIGDFPEYWYSSLHVYREIQLTSVDGIPLETLAKPLIDILF